MPGAKERGEQRAEAYERPFENDVRPFGCEREQKREADREIEEPPQHIDDGEDSPTPDGEANGV